MYDWQPLNRSELGEVFTPALLFDEERIERNIRRAVEMADGETDRLRPHVKTHKCPEIVKRALKAGIVKHKCATLLEAQMLAECGASDILIAYQMIGPNCRATARLMAEFPNARFSSVVDDLDAARQLGNAMRESGRAAEVWIDLDVGMGRTGIAPDDCAVQLCRELLRIDGLRLRGLHAYDGHNRSADVNERRGMCEAVLGAVRGLRDRLERDGAGTLSLVVGGTPPYPFYAAESDLEASPGTFALHDHGYRSTLPDLGFEPAAALVTRVISRPRAETACVDLGHKAIAADPVGPRGVVISHPGVETGPQSEEHWTLRLNGARLKVGDALYICPTHICPTAALHKQALAVRNGAVVGVWSIARERFG